MECQPECDDDSEVVLNPNVNQNNAKAGMVKRKKRNKATEGEVTLSSSEPNRQEGERQMGYVMPITSTDSVCEQNKCFESFIMWMDKYKQFEEWEKQKKQQELE